MHTVARIELSAHIIIHTGNIYMIVYVYCICMYIYLKYALENTSYVYVYFGALNAVMMPRRFIAKLSERAH